jgi:hypothetical protein
MGIRMEMGRGIWIGREMDMGRGVSFKYLVSIDFPFWIAQALAPLPRCNAIIEVSSTDYNQYLIPESMYFHLISSNTSPACHSSYRVGNILS